MELYKEAADFTVGNIQRNASEMLADRARKKRNAANRQMHGDVTARYRGAKAAADKTGKKIARKAAVKGAIGGSLGTLALGGAGALAYKARKKKQDER